MRSKRRIRCPLRRAVLQTPRCRYPNLDIRKKSWFVKFVVAAVTAVMAEDIVTCYFKAARQHCKSKSFQATSSSRGKNHPTWPQCNLQWLDTFQDVKCESDERGHQQWRGTWSAPSWQRLRDQLVLLPTLLRIIDWLTTAGKDVGGL